MVSLLAALGGLLVIFAEQPLIVRIFLRPPEGEVSTLLLSLLKEMGGMVLMLAALPWLASRNPLRQDVSAVLLVGAICRPARSSRSALLAEAAGGALGACREFLKSDLSAAG
jgi:hypothetical protein